jgi:hypothetical protein
MEEIASVNNPFGGFCKSPSWRQMPHLAKICQKEAAWYFVLQTIAVINLLCTFFISSLVTGIDAENDASKNMGNRLTNVKYISF